MGLSSLFPAAIAGGIAGGIGQGAAAIAQDRQKQAELAHKVRLEEIAANKGTMTPSDISTVFSALKLPPPVGLSGRVDSSAVNALMTHAQKQADTERALAQGRQVADDMTQQYGRVVPKPGDEQPGPIQPTVDDPYARGVINTVRTTGLTDKTAPQVESVGKAFSERAEKDRQRKEGLDLLERMGVLPKTQAAAPDVAPGGKPFPPALTTGPTDSPETIAEVDRAREARSRISPDTRRDRAPAGGATAKPPLPPGTRMSTSVPVPTVHGDGKLEVRMSEPTDPHDLAAIAEYGTTFRNLPNEHRQYIRGLLQKEKVDVSSAQGAGGVTAKFGAEQDLPLYHTLPAGKHAVDAKTGVELDTIGMKQKDLESGKHKIVDTKTLDALKSISESESIMAQYAEMSKSLATQPGANWVQALTQHMQTKLGIANPGVDFDAMRGSVLRMAGAMQGSRVQLSDADRKAVEGMLPTQTDTVQTAMQRLERVGKLLQAMRDAHLGNAPASKIDSLIKQAAGSTAPPGYAPVPGR